MDFKIELVGIKEALKKLDAASKELPYATSRAINDTAKLVKEAEVAKMREVFDKPTPWVLNSLYIKPSTKERLEAIVYFKDQAQKYMLPHVFGGTREQKRSEMWLKSFWVPGHAARLNQYGNISPGQITQILSATKTHPDIYAWTTARSLKRNKKPRDYFIVRHQKGKLFPGVWERTGRRTSVRPILKFIPQPRYTKRYPFFEVAHKTAEQNLNRLFKQWLSRLAVTP